MPNYLVSNINSSSVNDNINEGSAVSSINSSVACNMIEVLSLTLTAVLSEW